MEKFSSANNLKMFYVIALTITFCSCDLFTGGDKNKPVKIHIKRGIPATGKLVLRSFWGTQEDSVVAYVGMPIRWIQQADEVREILKIYEKSHKAVFSVIPHAVAGTDYWEGAMDSSAAEKIVRYSIDWLDTGGVMRTYDPKIAVRPNAR